MSGGGGRYGWIDGPIRLELLPDGRSMRVTETRCYTDPQGRRWEAPAGAVVNGASIPWILTLLISLVVAVLRIVTLQWRGGGWIYAPYCGLFREASVFHDEACRAASEKVQGDKVTSEDAKAALSPETFPPSHPSWREVHAMLYWCSRWSGEYARRAWVIWAAVHLFGPRLSRREELKRQLRWIGSAAALVFVVLALNTGCRVTLLEKHEHYHCGPESDAATQRRSDEGNTETPASRPVEAEPR